MTDAPTNKRSWIDRQRQRIVIWWKTKSDVPVGKAALIYALCGLYLGFFLVPVIWLFSSSMQTSAVLFSSEHVIFAPLSGYTLSNLIDIMMFDDFQLWLRNSIIVAIGTTILSLVLGLPAAYSLSRFDYRGKYPIIVYFLSARMLPPVLISIPIFAIMAGYGLSDTHLGIVLAHTVLALPLVVWLMKGYFDNIPDSVDNAALIDGCNHFDVLVRIMLPLSKPGIAVAGYWAFITSWNDFLFASIISQSTGSQTVPVGLDRLLSDVGFGLEWNVLLAAATIMLLPSLILFLLIQDWIVEGMKGTGGDGMV